MLIFSLYFGLMIVKIYVSFLVWKKKDKVLAFNIVHFSTLEISTSL